MTAVDVALVVGSYAIVRDNLCPNSYAVFPTMTTLPHLPARSID